MGWLPMNPWGGGSDLWLFLGVVAFVVMGVVAVVSELRKRL